MNRNTIRTTALLGAAALSLTACGTEEAPAPAPATVTQTATEQVDRVVTPTACLEYIELSKVALESASRIIGSQGEALAVTQVVLGNQGEATEAEIKEIQGITNDIATENATLDDISLRFSQAEQACKDQAGELGG